MWVTLTEKSCTGEPNNWTLAYTINWDDGHTARQTTTSRIPYVGSTVFYPYAEGTEWAPRNDGQWNCPGEFG
ncbi:hypothetical protein ACI79O_13950 [Geodermatophilus sp. SYSU D00696]